MKECATINLAPFVNLTTLAGVVILALGAVLGGKGWISHDTSVELVSLGLALVTGREAARKQAVLTAAVGDDKKEIHLVKHKAVVREKP